ncbi:MAG TPA: bacillithiol biosynthesis cysteine-adding enzyme BshC, partial [Puia sp.]|nr:bacillithiol biosynthesis cysteine-adding enzyme BshC [Puia sp.]
YESAETSTEVKKNIDLLRLQNTFTITTAHQPAIFTGNLYFIYKIAHVLKLAKSLSEQLPEFQFVPVYYMGNEDADLAELGSFFLGKEKVSWDTDQKGAIGRMKTDGLGKIINRIASEFLVQPFGDELIEMLKTSYLKSHNIQEATFVLINKIFGSQGLLVMIPDSADLKRGMQTIFENDLLNQISSKIVGRTVESFPTSYKVQAQPRAINLFYLRDHVRELIELNNDGFEVRNTSLKFSKEEILSELESNPERFSPNVILRGIYQSLILPDVIFVGGGGETGYWLELKELFEHYEIPFPVLVLRNSFLIIEKKWKEKIVKAGIELFDLFKTEDELLNETVKKETLNQLSLKNELDAAETFYAGLNSIASKVDPTLVQHVESMRIKSLNEIKEFEKKLLRNEKRKYSDIRRQIHDIKDALFPFNNLQERVDNFIPYYAKWGRDFINQIIEKSPLIEPKFTILEET